MTKSISHGSVLCVDGIEGARLGEVMTACPVLGYAEIFEGVATKGRGLGVESSPLGEWL